MNSGQSAILSAEFRLAVACCRFAFSGDRIESIQRGARGIDWNRFATLVGQHRVDGLAWHALDRVGVPLPQEVARLLSASARSIADHGLRAAAASLELDRAFADAGIDLLFVKGLTVARLAYGNPFLKMSWDVDALIPLGRIAESAALLEALGYRLILPAAADGSELGAWHRRRKESVWVHDDKRLHLELHGRLADDPRSIPLIGLQSPRQQVEVAAGIVLPTLAPDPLFTYLCVHGAASGWNRLKWLADLAALLHGRSEEELHRLYAASQALGAGRAAAQAMLLAQNLFDIPIGDDLTRRLGRDRVTRWLVRIALSQMVGRADRADPTELWFGTLPIHLSQLLIAPGWTAKAKLVGRRAGESLRNAAARRSRGRDHPG